MNSIQYALEFVRENPTKNIILLFDSLTDQRREVDIAVQQDNIKVEWHSQTRRDGYCIIYGDGDEFRKTFRLVCFYRGGSAGWSAANEAWYADNMEIENVNKLIDCVHDTLHGRGRPMSEMEQEYKTKYMIDAEEDSELNNFLDELMS